LFTKKVTILDHTKELTLRKDRRFSRGQGQSVTDKINEYEMLQQMKWNYY